MEVKEGYKHTEVGVIPEDWQIKTVGDISQVKTGPFGSALHEKDYVNDGTPIITVEHLGDRGVLHENLPMVSEADKVRLKGYSLRRGDIVFSRVGSVDRNALIRSEDGWLFSGRLLRVRLIGKDVDSSYLSHHFHSEAFKQRVRDVAVGQTMASINTQILMGVKAILPSTITEQKAIAEALSDADALIEALEELIAKKRQVKQGAMQELLTGRRRLPGFSGEWEVKKLGEVCGKITTGKLDANAMVEDGEYRFYTCAKEYYQINTFAFDTEALLVSGNGANVGYIHHYKGKFNAYQRTYVLFDFQASVTYLKYYMDLFFQKRILVEVNAGNTPYIKMDTLTAMEVHIPNTKEEQQAIATILSDIDIDINTLELQRGKMRLLKQGMMQELLTGRIRLV